jgi:hypothetical protein
MSRRAPHDTWPSLRIAVELMPWAWRLSWYRDDIETRCWFLNAGPLIVECMANRPLFTQVEGITR